MISVNNRKGYDVPKKDAKEFEEQRKKKTSRCKKTRPNMIFLR